MLRVCILGRHLHRASRFQFQSVAGAKMSTLSAAVGAPTAACVPPGQCFFTEEWSSATLLEKADVNHDTFLATFGLPDDTKALGLSTCACILSKFNEEGTPDPIVRPYTPVSTNALVGKFQLAIKVYEGGKMSNHILKMPIGGTLDFKHIPFNVKIQYPFAKKNLTMLVGGTGITPMIQALHAVLGTPSDDTKVSLIFGNKTQKDILCKEVLDQWSADFPERLKVVHVLSDEPADSAWAGPKGFITKEIVAEHCAPASEDTMVFVCGPPPMYAALCGPRDVKDVTGLLSDMGYSKDHVFKF
mmetsp:Transcript_98172/g.184624  ORF Transcript_98172/g.184624 Transcript_98172/m.184624 type:complete len:301 (-) Transcript_98172:121-1023(-)